MLLMMIHESIKTGGMRRMLKTLLYLSLKRISTFFRVFGVFGHLHIETQTRRGLTCYIILMSRNSYERQVEVSDACM